MNPVKVPISICPHHSGAKPHGHYIIVNGLFPKGTPILKRQQFVGFNGFLFITIAITHTTVIDTNFKVITHLGTLDAKKIDWLGSAKLYTTPKGLRIYLPEDILKAGDYEKIKDIGIFRKAQGPKFGVYYLEVPRITGNVLLGKERIEDGRY